MPGLVWLLCALVALVSERDAQSAALRRSLARPLAADRQPLFSASGAPIGTWSTSADAVSLRPEANGLELVAPLLQRWLGSEDGRTLVGAGEVEAPEHPFELRFVVYRDGQRVAEPPEVFATESAFTVGADGTVAIAGHAPGRRGEPRALALTAAGRPLWSHALPRATMARDPVLFGERLLVRVHGLLTEGMDGAVYAVDGPGPRLLLEVPGALRLAGFPAARAALVLTRDSLRWIDALDGHELWRRALALRPAGEHALALWRARARDALALVTAGLPRAGEPGPTLLLLDPRDGAVLARQELGDVGSPADVCLWARGEELVLDCDGRREVFTWER